MTIIEQVNIGNAPDDGTGDTLREGFNKINTNFTNLNNEVEINTAKVSFPEAPQDGNQYARKDGGWEEVTSGGAVDSVNGKTGIVVLDTDDISEGVNKYVSATQKANIDENTSNRNLLKVSANDTTANYLRSKLTAGTNITITEVNDGGNEIIQIDNTATPGTGDNTYINNTKIDSTDGTNSTYGVINGLVNGVNTVFTVSTGEYASGTLKVSRNGKGLVLGDNEDWTETNPATGTFTFNTAPEVGDEITVEYITKETTNSNLLFEKNVQNITSNYTVLETDRNIFVDATSGDVSITLPAITDMDSLGLRFVKSDNTGNSVIIETPGSELISGASNYSMSIPYEDIGVITNGANYFLISN